MLLATLLATQLAAVVDPDFAEAKARADEYESLLAPRDLRTLVEAQERALDAALKVCDPAPARTAPITIVLRVNREGRPESTWRHGDTDFAVCMERELATARLPVAAGEAFYTSYELSFAP
jgi:hypothetical protein